MSDIRDRVKLGLSEIRTLVLGPHILLGFQYEAVFQERFASLPPMAKSLELAAFALLLAVVTLVIAPATFHRIAEDGDATRGQCRFVRGIVSPALVLFALAIAVNLVIATSGSVGWPAAEAMAGASLVVALGLWFGIEIAARAPATEEPMKDVKLPMKEKVTELMTEVRIVLPGVQALLGFQFAAYLTKPFHQLPAVSQAVHTASLLLLLLAMIFLMTPAPFHRLAEHGEPTARVNRVGVGFMLAAAGCLALGLAGDFYVAVRLVSGSFAWAAIGSCVAALFSLAIWFALPLAKRRGPEARGDLTKKVTAGG